MGGASSTVWKPNVKDTVLFDAKYTCIVNKLAENWQADRAEVEFTKTMKEKYTKNMSSDSMREFIAKSLTDNGMKTLPSMVEQAMTVPISLLSKQTRRRLGWKPSHDIPRRHDGSHPLI